MCNPAARTFAALFSGNVNQKTFFSQKCESDKEFIDISVSERLCELIGIFSTAREANDNQIAKKIQVR